jgi:hypothetical protein
MGLGLYEKRERVSLCPSPERRGELGCLLRIGTSKSYADTYFACFNTY